MLKAMGAAVDHNYDWYGRQHIHSSAFVANKKRGL